MELPLNHFKRALQTDEAQMGIWLALGSAYSAEICAGAGFDWVLIDGEHAPNDLGSTLAQLQAVAPYPSHPIVRPVFGTVENVKQLLDIGAQTLLIPLMESEEQARTMVRAMRYPPEGVRGVGSAIARASRWNAVPDYAHKAAAELCLLVQIETRAGLQNLDAIARVEGVDGLFIGPNDLAASLGHLGEHEHPEVLELIDDAIRRIQAAGKAPGVLTTSHLLARQYIAMGCKFVAIAADTTLLAEGARSIAQMYK